METPSPPTVPVQPALTQNSAIDSIANRIFGANFEQIKGVPYGIYWNIHTPTPRGRGTGYIGRCHLMGKNMKRGSEESEIVKGKRGKINVKGAELKRKQ